MNIRAAVVLSTLTSAVLFAGIGSNNNVQQVISAAHASAQRTNPTLGAAPKNGGDYVGSDTCITCHDDPHRRFKDTPMGRAMAHPQTPVEKLGCESCHGPGKAHVDAGGGKET